MSKSKDRAVLWFVCSYLTLSKLNLVCDPNTHIIVQILNRLDTLFLFHFLVWNIIFPKQDSYRFKQKLIWFICINVWSKLWNFTLQCRNISFSPCTGVLALACWYAILAINSGGKVRQTSRDHNQSDYLLQLQTRFIKSLLRILNILESRLAKWLYLIIHNTGFAIWEQN